MLCKGLTAKLLVKVRFRFFDFMARRVTTVPKLRVSRKSESSLCLQVDAITTTTIIPSINRAHQQARMKDDERASDP